MFRREYGKTELGGTRTNFTAHPGNFRIPVRRGKSLDGEGFGPSMNSGGEGHRGERGGKGFNYS